MWNFKMVEEMYAAEIEVIDHWKKNEKKKRKEFEVVDGNNEPK